MSNRRNMAHVAYENFLKYENQQKARNGKREESLKAARSSSSGLLAPRMKEAMEKRNGQLKTKQPIDSVLSIVEMIRNRGDV